MSALFNVPESAIKSSASLSSSVHFGEYDEIGGKFKTEVVLEGQSVVYVNRVEEVCCGAVGSAGKVCVRVKEDCGTNSHRLKTMKDEVEAGLYIKAGATDIYLTPCLPKSYLTLSVLEEFLGRSFEDDLEVSKYFDFVKRLGDDKGSAVDSFAEVEEFNLEAEEAMNAKTPAKKKHPDVVSFDEVYEGVKTSYATTFMEAGNLELLSAVKELFEFSFVDQDSTRSETYNMAQKLNSVVQQLGTWPANSTEKPPPSVWLALADLLADKNRVEKLEVIVQQLSSAGMYQNQTSVGIGTPQPRPPPYPPSMSAQAHVDQQIQSVISRTRDGFLGLERSIVEIKGVGAYRSNQPVPSLRELGEERLNHDRLIRRVTKDFYAFEKSFKDAKKGNKDKGRVVTMGSHSFSSIRELSAWCDTIFTGTIPFGVFVDVYTVLQRIISFMDVTSDSSTLHDMDCRRKIQLSADEAVAIEAFAQPLPKLFRGTTKDPALHHNYLPGISSKERWEDDIGLTGVKLTISENLETVRNGVQSAIDARLDPENFSATLEPVVRELQALAREMLSYSISFIESLSTFMSSTYTRLENSGFTKKSSWELVSKLVHRVFAKDCHSVRSKVSEHLDASHKKSMGVGVLWGTLATHQVLREYMAHGIENHPSISSEYVRFLVAHCGLSRLDKLEARVKKIEEDVKTAVTNAATAKRTADQAFTKANEAIREAKKR